MRERSSNKETECLQIRSRSMVSRRLVDDGCWLSPLVIGGEAALVIEKVFDRPGSRAWEAVSRLVVAHIPEDEAMVELLHREAEARGSRLITFSDLDSLE
jgi:hypothetical protein